MQPDGGWLISPGSYVELGAVGGVGTVGLLMSGSDWQLTIPNGVLRADISLKNGSGIYATGASGSIRLLAQNIDISRSLLQIGIPNDSRLPAIHTGDLDLNATGSITLSFSGLRNLLSGRGTLGSTNLSAGDRVSLDLAVVGNFLLPTGVGKAGDININTGSLSLINGAALFSNTSGQGDAGSVNINARDTVSFDDDSSVYTTVDRTGVGNAGNINIATGSLSLTNHALLNSYAAGQGNAGSVSISARDTVSLGGRAALNSYTLGPGNAGNLNINAYDTVFLDSSTVFNLAYPNAFGNPGGINITTGSLALTNGAALYSYTLGQGKDSSVTINARDRVSLDGEYSTGITSGGRSIGSIYNTSSIFTRVASSAMNQGGDVTITTGSLSLTNGDALNTSTEGQGNAGRATIQARDSIQINGTAPTRTDYPSQVFTSARRGSVGDGGGVNITTGSLSVSDRGRINTNAQGQGRAGKLQIQATGAVSFDGGNAISTLDAGAGGSGGDIDIAARSLSILNGAQLAASTAGDGNAGSISVSADTVGLSSGGQLLTTTSTSGRAATSL